MKKDTLPTAIVLASLAALGYGDTYLVPALRVTDEGGLREHIQTLASGRVRGPGHYGNENIVNTIMVIADALGHQGSKRRLYHGPAFLGHRWAFAPNASRYGRAS